MRICSSATSRCVREREKANEKAAFNLSAAVLYLCCMRKSEQAPVYTPTPLAWDISTPPPMPAPSIDVDLSDARERGYVEIDIDKSDGYRDFVLESRITDDYGESTFSA